MIEPIRILFVEDVPADMELACLELQKAGIAVIAYRVESEEELIQALKAFSPHLAICDYSMPRFDGLTAIRVIGDYDQTIPVIIFTGSQNEEIAVKCIQAGATDYVLKEHLSRLPFSVQECLVKRELRLAREKMMEEEKKKNEELEKLNADLVAARHASLNLLEDLTAEMKQREELFQTLEESEKKYRQLVELTPIGIIIHVDHKIVYTNPAAALILGVPEPEKMVGRAMMDFVHTDFRQGVEDHVKNIVDKRGMAPLTEEKLLRADGKVVVAEVIAIPFTFEGKHAVQVVFNDITERKKAEEELKQKIDELERFNELTVDREIVMIQLKKEINELLQRAGKEVRYKLIDFDSLSGS